MESENVSVANPKSKDSDPPANHCCVGVCMCVVSDVKNRTRFNKNVPTQVLPQGLELPKIPYTP